MGGIMYTREDMERVHALYERNWEKLVESVGTKKHAHYIKRERLLQRKSVEIVKSFNNIIPCKLHNPIRCEKCNGYLLKKPKKNTNTFYWVMGNKDNYTQFCHEKKRQNKKYFIM